MQLTINKKISDLTIKLLKKFCLSDGLRFLDVLIAATAQENKLIFITANLKHFRVIKGLTLLSQKEAFKE